ncbi:MAG: hypothetical protein V1835_04725 [Candidatus Micrarchaeota archaeon]
MGRSGFRLIATEREKLNFNDIVGFTFRFTGKGDGHPKGRVSDMVGKLDPHAAELLNAYGLAYQKRIRRSPEVWNYRLSYRSNYQDDFPNQISVIFSAHDPSQPVRRIGGNPPSLH